mgnify:CR=1 FL=1
MHREYKLTIAGTGGCGCAFNQEITIAPCCDTTTAAADAPEAIASTVRQFKAEYLFLCRLNSHRITFYSQTGRCACLEFDA